MDKFYGPEEDTYFMIDVLIKYFESNRSKRSLEVGVGNGQVSKLISSKSKDHVGVDINPNAISETKLVCASGEYFESDLFSKVSGKFDLIVFNPPYLPERKDEEDDWIKKAIVGGKKGYEIIVQFLEELPKYLSDDGKCFLLFSNLSRPEVILEKCSHKMIDYKLVLEKSIMIEKLYVYEISKSKRLIELESKGYKYITFFAKGSHGKVFTAMKNSVKYGIKVLNERNQAFEAIKNEAKKMQIVNKVNVGPKFIEAETEYMIYEFVFGKPWQNVYSNLSLNEIEDIILKILEQCHKMDSIGFEKKEMKRPLKNLLIGNGKPVLIDFERGIITKKPSNVTQFLQYLFNSKFAVFLRNQGIVFERKRIIELGLMYKKQKISFKDVKDYVKTTFRDR